MPTYDFSSPFVAARIIDRDGNSFPLWTNIGGSETDRPTLPGGEELQALAFLQEVQVTLHLGAVPKISAQLSPPFREGMAFLNSDLANSAGQNQLEVQFGYSGGTSTGGAVLTTPFFGMLLEPDITIDVDIQINLNTEGVGPMTAASQTGDLVAGEGQTRRLLIDKFAKHGGRVMDINFDDADADDNARDLLDAVTLYVQGNKTDWMAMWELVTACRCWMSFIGNTLYILSRYNRWRAAPVRRYRLFDYPGGRLAGATLDVIVGQLSEAELPILSFTSSSPAVWLPQNQFGVRMVDVGEHTRTLNERLLTVGELANPTGGDGSETIEGDENVPPNPDSRPGDPDNADARNTATEEMGRGANLGVQIEIETLGDPGIIPGALVRVAGLGRRFDNRVYAVHVVSHTIGVGGFSTNLTLNTNLDVLTDAASGGVPGTGSPNVLEVDEQGDLFSAHADVVEDFY